MSFVRPADSLVLEGIVTSRSPQGQLNVAPMGPIAPPDIQWLTLRPFQTSTTCDNLRAHGEGVFHIVDDVRLIAAGAIGRWTEPPPVEPARTVRGDVLVNSCEWFEFRIEEADFGSARTTLRGRVVHHEVRRPLRGFNRARFAVVEAAILATRLHLLPRDEIEQQLNALRPLVAKTGGTREHEAFELLTGYIEEHYD